ncbi:DUF4129 domain-containing protein [Budviciaceae bacterium BWR-B9]|uniref:DUF4129 domain-containing protein n=1 Tax=Limnobaculum allomyrinae TaxID=2791986 RepID=A0ABS1IR98_9GAMM|nr:MULTISPECIES: DUF4129 domain-containing protein [Limnobaculum]MBK5144285.1 DUF4129 domain-containing protein [Limnobaculum allomyrinae]MBV7691970.1 DUF4129 domain-containing protein [Limnobaculum sp. M2-1]
MRLDRLAIVLRTRPANEAIDLGVRMAMHWFKPLYIAWLCFSLPVIGLLFSLSYWAEFSYTAIYLLIWWIKPMLDRMALFVISRAVFGSAPTLRQSMKAIPTLLFKTRLIRALTWARFSPYRSLTLPVDVLEGVKGRNAKIRRKAISNYIGINAAVLTLFGFVVEKIFPVCAIAFVAMISIDNNSYSDDLLKDLWFNNVSYHSLMALGFYILGILLWEPIYVAAGFSLYLKRRSDIEAWDIELEFRKIEKRSRIASSTLFAAMLLVLTLGISGYPSHSYASQNNSTVRQETINDAPEKLQQILKQPEYGGKEVRKRLKFMQEKKVKKPNKKPDFSPPPVSANPNSALVALTGAGQWMLWGILALVVIAIAYFIIIRLPDMRGQKGQKEAPPAQIAGLDIQPESLPENIAEVALSMIHSGDLRSALSLLFRGSLSVLAHRDRVMFRSSDTEQDCIRLVKRAELNSADFFIKLTQLWLAQAYAHRSPDITKLEQLCREWPTHYDHQSQWEAS